MTYVLDASVAVAALRDSEPGHRAALRRCAPLFAGRDEIVVPALFDLEVSSALVRRGVASDRLTEFFDLHLRSRRLLPIGPRAVRAIRAVIHTTRLRAAGATYVWVAAREGVPMVTADRAVLERAAYAGAKAIAP